MSKLKEIFGRNIKKYRIQFGWTQEEMAEKIDVSQTFFANLERGNRGASFETVELIAKTFGVPCSALFEESPADISKNALAGDDKFRSALFCKKLEKSLKSHLSESLHEFFERGIST